MNEPLPHHLAPALALAVAATSRSRAALTAQVREHAAGPGAATPGAPTESDWHALLARIVDLAATFPLSVAQAFGVTRTVDAARQGSPPSARAHAAILWLVDDTVDDVQEQAAPPVEVTVPAPLPPAQHASWQALLEVAGALPTGWTIVGGQMVALHCWERNAQPSRPTHDGDAVLDVRAHRSILRDYTARLVDLGFESRGVNVLNGHEHRWVRAADGAQLDVLVPDGGPTAGAATGVGGSTTVSTPGGADALAQSRPATVRLGNLTGTVHRPHLAGALVAKARAAGNPFDSNPRRHLQDAAILAGLIGGRRDAQVLRRVGRTPKHRKTLAALVGRMDADRSAWTGAWPTGGAPGQERVERGLAVLRSIVDP